MTVPDKLNKMAEIIWTEITEKMDSYTELQYLDIKLDLFNIDNVLTINAFSRGHHVREHPDHRITHRAAREWEPASDKGDGSLFLALVVMRCNEVFSDKVWMGLLGEWWHKKGVCKLKNACIKTERSGHMYEINNKIFLDWAKNKIKSFLEEYNSKQKGGKRRYKRTHKKSKKKKTKNKRNNKKKKSKKKKTHK